MSEPAVMRESLDQQRMNEIRLNVNYYRERLDEPEAILFYSFAEKNEDLQFSRFK